MSRFMEILTNWSTKHISSVQVREILRDVQEKLGTRMAEISIRFKYFVEKRAPVTGTAGFLDYNCLFYGKLRGEQFSFVLGVEVPVQLVCPCSKEISQEGAHNQRAMLRVKLEYYPDTFIWLEDLIESIQETGSSQVYPVIKREDEKFITEVSFANPKFVEDTLRDMVNLFRSDDRIRWFEAECDSYESIHNHNAFASQRENKENDVTGAHFSLVPLDELQFMR